MSEKYRQLYLELLLKLASKVKFTEELWTCGDNEFSYKLDNSLLIVRKSAIDSSISSFELVLANNTMVYKKIVTSEKANFHSNDEQTTSVMVSMFDKTEVLLDSEMLHIVTFEIMSNDEAVAHFTKPEHKEVLKFLDEMNTFIRSVEKNHIREINGIEEKLKSSLLEL